jgi:hypothetical protein
MLKRYGTNNNNNDECYPDFFRGRSELYDSDEPSHLRQLSLLLVEFCRNMSPRAQEAASENQALSDEAVDAIVMRHLMEIGDQLKVTWRDRIGSHWKPEPPNRIFLDAPKPRTTLSAINDWPSTSEEPLSLKTLSEKALLKSIRCSLVGAKASAAFCCGGSVAFSEAGCGKDAKVYTGVAPVTLRWDDKHTACGKVTFSQTSSTDAQFQQSLEQLCLASEPASFGRGGETVLDGMRFFRFWNSQMQFIFNESFNISQSPIVKLQH